MTAEEIKAAYARLPEKGNLTFNTEEPDGEKRYISDMVAPDHYLEWEWKGLGDYSYGSVNGEELYRTDGFGCSFCYKNGEFLQQQVSYEEAVACCEKHLFQNFPELLVPPMMEHMHEQFNYDN